MKHLENRGQKSIMKYSLDDYVFVEAKINLKKNILEISLSLEHIILAYLLKRVGGSE